QGRVEDGGPPGDDHEAHAAAVGALRAAVLTRLGAPEDEVVETARGALEQQWTAHAAAFVAGFRTQRQRSSSSSTSLSSPTTSSSASSSASPSAAPARATTGPRLSSDERSALRAAARAVACETIVVDGTRPMQRADNRYAVAVLLEA